MEDDACPAGRRSSGSSPHRKGIGRRVLVDCGATTVEITPMARVGHPPPRRRLSATGSVHGPVGPHGGDLTIFTSEGWAWCSNMSFRINAFQAGKILGQSGENVQHANLVPEGPNRWPDKMVADKMVRTKWYGQNGIRTKWYWTKWYGQNDMDKMVQFYIFCTL